MKQSINWGVLSTAKIGVAHVIPAIQRSERGRVVAIASRESARAADVASSLDIPRSYGSYEALLADDEVDAIYNPLPNHLHVEWSEKALAAGKHVLCEKPVGLDAEDAERLQVAAANHAELQVMEAFMYRFHPQWQTVKRWIDENRIGKLMSIQTIFSYFNDDANNIRNQAGIGGGGMMDIGCYPISQSRYLFGGEPQRIFSTMQIHPQFGVDVIASAILDFGEGSATFTCSTQMSPYQRVNILGSTGRIDIEIPVNAPANQTTTVWLTEGDNTKTEVLPACDQYTLQAEAMANAILDGAVLPVTLEDAVHNMKVIDAAFRSHESGRWEVVTQ